jgi:hypothetical protein
VGMLGPNCVEVNMWTDHVKVKTWADRVKVNREAELC